MKGWMIESSSPQYMHVLSGLIPNLKSSFLVTVIQCTSLNWNYPNSFSLQLFLIDLKIVFQLGLFKDTSTFHLLTQFALQHEFYQHLANTLLWFRLSSTLMRDQIEKRLDQGVVAQFAR